MRYANVIDGVVAEVSRVDPFAIFSTEYASKFIECPDYVEKGYLFNNGEFSAPQSESLSEKRARIWDEIKAYRDHLVQTGGYKVGAHWYHSDTFSRTQQIALIVMGASIPAGIVWKTLDNGYVPMTQTLAQQIFGAGAAQDAALFAKAADHKSALDASSDPDSYNWKAGWPETYQGT